MSTGSPETPANGSTSKTPTAGSTPKTNAHHLDTQSGDPVHNGLAGLWNWVETNAKLMAALVVVAFLGALGYLGLQFLEKRQERTAQDAYYAVESKFSKLKEGFDRAKFQAAMPSSIPADQAKDLKPATGDLEKDYGPLLRDLEMISSKHAGTAAGAQAAILAASTYLEYKQPDKAIELAQIPSKNLKANHVLTPLSKVLWGSALATKGDCQGAVGIWQQVLDNKVATHLHGDVSLRAGLCLEQIGQTDRAAEMYRKASASAPESTAAQTAKSLLRAIEIKEVKAAKPASQG